MNDKWKDIYIGFTLFVVLFMAMSYVVDILLIDGLSIDSSFLGSIIGGVIGAAGVVGTTYFLIEANKQATKNAAELNDQTERERIHNEFLLNKNEEIMNLLTELYELNNSRYNALHDYISIQRKIDKLISAKKEINQKEILYGVVNDAQLTLLRERYQRNINRREEILRKETVIRGKMISKLSNLQTKSIFLKNLEVEITDFKRQMSGSIEMLYHFVENDVVDLNTLEIIIEKNSEIEKKAFNEVMRESSNNIEAVFNTFLSKNK